MTMNLQSLRELVEIGSTDRAGTQRGMRVSAVRLARIAHSRSGFPSTGCPQSQSPTPSEGPLSNLAPIWGPLAFDNCCLPAARGCGRKRTVPSGLAKRGESRGQGCEFGSLAELT
jgi:hypothetical protein